MATHDKGEPLPAINAIVTAAPNGDAHATGALDANAALESSTQDIAADAANTALASRPRRSLRSAGRAAEEKIVKRTVKIITKRAQRKWDAERLLTDPKSPLAKANLRTILSYPMAWSSLDEADHAEILALFPDQSHIRTAEDGTAQPDMASLMNDDSFRYDCAAYTQNLAQGRHDPEWLAQAWAAHERRKAGDFKEFLRTKFETDWEVKLPPEVEPDVDQHQQEEAADGKQSMPTDEAIGANGIADLEQPATPVVSEFTTRAKLSKTKVIFLSFATIKKPHNVDVILRATGKDFKTIRKELLSHYPNIDPAAASAGDRSISRAVVIIDSLNALASAIPQALASFLSGVITPAASIVAVYHTDVPVLLPKTFSEYEPEPFTILCHLATAILRLASLSQEIVRQRARDKALVEPEWGINEEREGVLIGLRGKGRSTGEVEESRGVVVTMELRRRSGRTVTETFILVRPDKGKSSTGKLLLRSDHPVFAAPGGAGHGAEEEEELPESTFNLGLTEKQRKDREGIVLPYFDAQTEVGGGDGGRILYEMGREDDFDEEEDEI
ncbi:hypothetical protein V2A60_008189 [Cordyceps javanica]